MARKKIIAGNWKMNMTPSQAVKLVEELAPLVKNDDVDVVYCVPAIDIVPVVNAVKGTNVQVGAENMYFEEKGAFTGEISAEMLVDAGVKYVIKGLASVYFSFISSSLFVGDNNISISFGDISLYCLYFFSSKFVFGLNFKSSTSFSVAGNSSKFNPIYSNFLIISGSIFFFFKSLSPFVLFIYILLFN